MKSLGLEKVEVHMKTENPESVLPSETQNHCPKTRQSHMITQTLEMSLVPKLKMDNIYVGNNSEGIMKGNNQENSNLSPNPDDPMVDIFNNEFAYSVCDNTKEAYKSTKIIDIFVSGPFQNRRSGFTYCSVIYGDQEARFLKSNYIKGFVRLVLSSLKFRNEELLRCGSYKDINIRKVEFGEESK
jgi:hypothetical protein